MVILDINFLHASSLQILFFFKFSELHPLLQRCYITISIISETIDFIGLYYYFIKGEIDTFIKYAEAGGPPLDMCHKKLKHQYISRISTNFYFY